jgi:large subunit ribosomal protein L4e
LQAVKVLEGLGAADDVRRVEDSKSVRAGKGKGRNRRYTTRRGPLLVTADTDSEDLGRAFRNLAGVDIANVDRLSLLQLAPGGHLGRFVIWTKAAFDELEALYGTESVAAAKKSGYLLPRPQMANADLARVINSNEVQSALRPAVHKQTFARQKKNPLKNKAAMDRLNPYAAVVRAKEAERIGIKAKKGVAKTGTQVSAARRKASKAYFRSITNDEFVRPADAKPANA